MKRSIQDSARRAVIAVGSGRGFVMETADRFGMQTVVSRVVVTAAHCLPHLPPAYPSAPVDERTYLALLGPLSDSEPSIMTTCSFVDPVADIAFLREPDGQLFDEKDSSAFVNFTEGAEVLRLGDMPSGRTQRGWLLFLDGCWAPCTVRSHHGGALWITEAIKEIVDGMSGSPILSDDGRALGVLCTSGGTVGERHTGGGPQPQLSACLPGWLLPGLRRKQKSTKE